MFALLASLVQQALTPVVTAKVLTCQETTEPYFQTNFGYFHHIRYQNKENLKSETDPVWPSWALLTSCRFWSKN